MRTLLSVISILISLNIFSQSVKEIKVSKKTIAESTTMSDIIKDIPKDCKVISFIYSMSVNGSLKEFSYNGNAFAPEIKSMIAKKTAGQWILIEHLSSECEKSHQKNYKIILE